jgi:glutamate racemase
VPGLAGAIEFGKSDEEKERLIREAFKDVSATDYDALILACTHYPLATEAFQNVLGAKIHLFDPAEAVGNRVERQFWPREVGNGAMRLCITKDSPEFVRFVERLFPDDEYEIEVVGL